MGMDFFQVLWSGVIEERVFFFYSFLFVIIWLWEEELLNSIHSLMKKWRGRIKRI